MRRLITTAILATAIAGVGGSAAFAQEPGCDSYGGACVSETATTSVSPSVLPTKLVKPRPNVGGLVVTGGETVMLLAIGGGAIAGGTALVTAGRKRKHAA